jgi:Subtilase family
LTDSGGGLPHLWVQGRAANRSFHRQGGGDPKVREVERRAHGHARKQELDDAIRKQLARRDEVDESVLEELRALGVIIVLEGANATFPLRVDSLERMSAHRRTPKRPWWRLLSVTDARGDEPEKAMVWVSDEYRAQFLRLFEEYLTTTTKNGNAQNRELVANIGRIRTAVLDDLWQSEGRPPRSGRHWWELWLAPGDDAVYLLRTFVADRPSMRMAERVLRLVDRTVAWVEAQWDELQILPFTGIPLTEIRRPELADTVEDLSVEERAELAEDLAERVSPADDAAPAVCHLDSGVRRSHVLLEPSLAFADVHSTVDETGADTRNHGTAMAALALLGPLDDLLLGMATVQLAHRLESVKILPDPSAPGHDPSAYGLLTAQAVSLPEAVAARRRVFCMPVTDRPDLPGRPSLWSASIDALAVGVGIGASSDGIELLGAPDSDAARLFIISAGNVAAADLQADYRAACDVSAVEDPAHAYNALTVGAYTELVTPPDDPSFEGWSVLAEKGDISPHSRTSLVFEHRSWPIKPDICMEGGNVLHDGADGFDERHPILSVRTAASSGDLAIGSANATSAATAQAARLAALAQARYPGFWPETIRGLLVHHAEWTPVMRGEIDAAVAKAEKLRMLRRYGWGVPSAEAVLSSTRTAVTLVTQDEFVPFTGDDFISRVFRLHQLPWPAEVLRDVAEGEVTLRVTLSYFIEPTASRRGWRRRYSYASHGLRFELKNPLETIDQFIRRVNHEAQQEEDEAPRPTSGSDRWLVGPNQRNTGSLHQDIWQGTGAELAECGVLAVHPVGGWWKYNTRRDRMNLPVRYALTVSLRTREAGVDLWTPIATEIGLPLEQLIAGT